MPIDETRSRFVRAASNQRFGRATRGHVQTRCAMPPCSQRTWLLAIFHPKVWLTLWGGLFVCAYPIAIATEGGGLKQALRSNAMSEWADATERELHIATAYEGFWAGALVALAAQALGFAWLFEGKQRAKLAVLFGAAMLACFMPGLIFASSRYDVSCAEDGDEHSFAAHCGLLWAWLAMGTAFTLILVSGLFHLNAGIDAAEVRQLH